jgi:hypothetical protein
MFSAGQRQTENVHFLEGIGTNEGAATWPVIATTGTESSSASASPVIRLVAPGPDVAIHTPVLPVERA